MVLRPRKGGLEVVHHGAASLERLPRRALHQVHIESGPEECVCGRSLNYPSSEASQISVVHLIGQGLRHVSVFSSCRLKVSSLNP